MLANKMLYLRPPCTTVACMQYIQRIKYCTHPGVYLDAHVQLKQNLTWYQMYVSIDARMWLPKPSHTLLHIKTRSTSRHIQMHVSTQNSDRMNMNITIEWTEIGDCIIYKQIRVAVTSTSMSSKVSTCIYNLYVHNHVLTIYSEHNKMIPTQCE